jgi:GNAT superfamily N-acetyltransferase
MIREKNIGSFLFSTDKAKLNIPYIHQYLSQQSYWAKNVPLEIVQESIRHAVAIGIYDTDQNSKQVGFARVVTDHATFGYLGDVFVDEAYRGRGLSKELMNFIMAWDEVKMFRRFILATKDAHTLYEKFGFRPLKAPEKFMEVHQPDLYLTLNGSAKTEGS